ATMNSVQPIIKNFHQFYPEVELINVMDESLIKELNETNVITENMIRRLVDIASKVDDANVDGILFTCSSFSPYIPEIKHLFKAPVLSADESMLKKAVNLGERIGVIATVKKAGPTTTQLLKEIAGDKVINIETVIIPEAFKMLENGNEEGHNQLIH